MRQSKAFLHTLRNPPADAEVPSHKLLSQAGFTHKLAAGIYSYSPSLYRVLKKISSIVREELDAAGAEEVMLPIMQPRSIWDESGRWDAYVNEKLLFHFHDRKNSELCLGPTHEEVITKLVASFVGSYKQLPVNLYQIQTKFRDEIRPRFGLMRGREFIMKDAYSFDVDRDAMDKSYEIMHAAYSKIFTRCGLEFIIADADSGAIGGSGSQEFVVTANTGEDVFLICNALNYGANQERAEAIIPPPSNAKEAPLTMEKESTPNVRTVEELIAFFPNIQHDRVIKALLYKATFKDRDEFVAALIRGDRDMNEVKLKNELGCLALTLASDEEVKTLTGAATGFLGPVNLTKDVRIIGDNSAKGVVNATSGANETGYHYTNTNAGRDYPEPEYKDICLAIAGDTAIGGNPEDPAHKLRATRGIEVGHIFKLGNKYSKAMGAEFTDCNGKPQNFLMGCYGIGISRVAAAAVEQSFDELGIIWPKAIAPWSVHLICMNPKKDEQREVADKLYSDLCEEKIEILYDDRKVSAGIKFKDADLIGLPLRIVVGKHASEGLVEIAKRKSLKDVSQVTLEQILPAVREFCDL